MNREETHEIYYSSGEKIKVLEHKKYSQAGNQAQSQNTLFCAQRVSFCDEQCCKVRHYSCEQNQYYILDIPAHVEIVAGCKQKAYPEFVRKSPIQRKHYREKQCELPRIKQQFSHLPQKAGFDVQLSFQWKKFEMLLVERS